MKDKFKKVFGISGIGILIYNGNTVMAGTLAGILLTLWYFLDKE